MIRTFPCIGKTLLMLLMLLPAGEASSFGTLNDQPENPLQTEFKSLDKNHNGYLTREESTHDQEIEQAFEQADQNHDGKLSDREYVETKSKLQQARVQRFLDDSTVTARIKAELLKDTGIRGLRISVETHHGQVILSGFVESEEQIRRAAQIASGVRGVVSVKNSLIFKG